MSGAGDQVRSATQIGIAALLFSSVPVVIHLTVGNTHPFLFNATQWVGLMVAFTAYCIVSFRTTFGAERSLAEVLRHALGIEAEASRPAMLRALVLVQPVAAEIRSQGDTAPTRIKHRRLGWLTLPFIGMIIAHTNYTFYVWSARYVDIAVSTAIYEMWPVVMVVALSRYDAVATESRGRRISAAKKMLMVAAFVALAFVILGQAGGEAVIPEHLGLGTVIGVVLACVAAVLSGLFPVTNMIYADTLAARYLAVTEPCCDTSQVDLDGPQGRRISLWFTAFGLVAAALLSVLLDVAAAASTEAVAPTNFGLTGQALMVGFILGVVVHGVGMLLLRVANLKNIDLGVNALFYMTPILALAWLAWAGISLSRADLFWIGSAMVIAANALLQLNPEDEIDYTAAGVDTPKGVRLGLMSLILALWGFGAFVYLRDDIIPAGLLRWNAPEYWALVGLSATVFALIYGFRTTRISSRATDEDDRMMRLFRRTEALCRQGRVPSEMLTALRELDAASFDQLPSEYRRCSHELSRCAKAGTLDVDEFAGLQAELDAFAHSRQQGRDFPELIAIFLFAILTVALAVTTRPLMNAVSRGEEAFLIELFTTVFVAVITYLTFALLDIRRERFIPLLARQHTEGDPDGDSDDGGIGFGILFRSRINTRGQRIVAFTIVAAMIAMYAALLYRKWL